MPNANWSNPTLTSTYTNFVSEVKNRDEDLALQFDGTTSTNLPTNTIRWDSAANRWKKWNGSSWAELTSTYALTALSTTGNANIGGTLGVTGAATLSSTLGVTGAITGSSTVSGTALIPTAATVPTDGVYLPAANTVAVATNGTGRLFIDSSGRVGIGTATPGYKLDVTGGSIGVNTTGGTAASLVFNQSGIGLAALGMPANENVLQFLGWNGASLIERARIDSSGRLLVGTSTATGDQLLVVQGYAGVSAGNAELGLRRGGNPSAADQGLGAISFQNNSGNTGARIEAISSGSWTSGSNHRSYLTFSTTADGASSPTERMRIGSDGAISSVIPGGSTLYPDFGARAWVNFNGTGTVAIRGSGNVTSITDNGTGAYTVNFTTAMPDASYSVALASTSTEWGFGAHIESGSNGGTPTTMTTSALRIGTTTDGGTATDSAHVTATIFR